MPEDINSSNISVLLYKFDVGDYRVILVCFEIKESVDLNKISNL